MLSLNGPGTRLCDGVTRRELLRVGGLGFTGLLLSDWFKSRAAATPRTTARAKSCILIYNYGGPSHLDTFDLKPDAPAEIRGEFRPIATRVPGIAISEHLPRLARLTNHCAIVRSVTHRDNDHAIGAYLALTGYSHPRNDVLGIEPPMSPQDLPSMGAVLSKLRASQRPVFSYVTLGDLRHLGHHDSMGQNAGCLGRMYDPFTVPFARPINGTLDLQNVTSVMANVDGAALDARRRLLHQMIDAAPTPRAANNLDAFTRRGFELLASPATRDAFDIAREPQPLRDSYGANSFGQSCLLARRLVEAGVPLTTVYSAGNRDWDTHDNNFRLLKDSLLPSTDRAFSALLTDLDSRGMLDETLVVWMSEMGRTPRINANAGRDHWTYCYGMWFAGAGIRGGTVVGESDGQAAYVKDRPVSPADVVATIYECLGIDPDLMVPDRAGRPIGVAQGGRPIREILG
jgi:hypothetical protein